MAAAGIGHIDFRKMPIFSEKTTGNNCNTAFGLHVVDSVSDDYNCKLYTYTYCIVLYCMNTVTVTNQYIEAVNCSTATVHRD